MTLWWFQIVRSPLTRSRSLAIVRPLPPRGAATHGASEKYMALFEKARAAAIASLLNPANQRYETYDGVWCQRDESMKYARLLDAGQYIDTW